MTGTTEKRSRSYSFATLALLLPSLAMAVTLMVIPTWFIFENSFSNRDSYGGVVGGFTFDNYTGLFSPIYFDVLVETLKIAVTTTVVCLLVGYPIAYYIAFRARKYTPVLLAALLLPFWVDFMIRIASWMVIMGRRGPLNAALVSTGLTDEPIRMIGTYPATLVGMVYAFLPVAVLPIYATLNGVDRRLLEASEDLGARPSRGFLKVTLPLSMPGVMTAVLFVFVPSMGVFAIPVLLGGGKNLILGNLIFQLFLEFRNVPAGAALSIVILGIASVMIAIYMNVFARVERRIK